MASLQPVPATHMRDTLLTPNNVNHVTCLTPCVWSVTQKLIEYSKFKLGTIYNKMR